MAVQSIPLRGDLPDFSERVRLEGKDYVLRFRLSDRESRWYLDVSDADGNPVASGLALCLYSAMGTRSRSTALPPGLLAVSDSATVGGGGEDPGPDDLGVRHSVVYFEQADLEEVFPPP